VRRRIVAKGYGATKDEKTVFEGRRTKSRSESGCGEVLTLLPYNKKTFRLMRLRFFVLGCLFTLGHLIFYTALSVHFFWLRKYYAPNHLRNKASKKKINTKTITQILFPHFPKTQREVELDGKVVPSHQSGYSYLGKWPLQERD